MKVEFDTKNWFQDKVLTAIISVGIIAVINMAMLISILCSIHNNSYNYPLTDGNHIQHGYKAIIRY